MRYMGISCVLLRFICYGLYMKDVNTPNTSRKQVEADILKNMRNILGRVNLQSQIDAKTKDEPVDRTHVLSVISHFTALKKSTKH